MEEVNDLGDSKYQVSDNARGVWWQRQGFDRHLESIADDIEHDLNVHPDDFVLWRCCQCKGWDRSKDHDWVHQHARGTPYRCFPRTCGHEMYGMCLLWIPFGIAVTVAQAHAQARKLERDRDQREERKLIFQLQHLREPSPEATLRLHRQMDEVRERVRIREASGPSAEEDEAVIATIPQKSPEYVYEKKTALE